MGLVLGAIEVLFLNKMFAIYLLVRKIFYKTSVYLISICLFLLLLVAIINSHRLNLPFYHVEVIRLCSYSLIILFF